MRFVAGLERRALDDMAVSSDHIRAIIVDTSGDRMQTLGIRQLKAHLSEYLKRVQGGERLVVTHRGRAIAMVTPAEAVAKLDWVHELVADGRARWSGGKPHGLSPKLKSKGKRASQMVIEDRR
jgi:prevent-host-death family protein